MNVKNNPVGTYEQGLRLLQANLKSEKTGNKHALLTGKMNKIKCKNFGKQGH